jgi:hypothetical protein
MSRTKDEILQAEEESFRGHSRRYRRAFIFMWSVFVIVAAGGAIAANGLTPWAQGTVWASPSVLATAGIVSAVALVSVGVVPKVIPANLREKIVFLPTYLLKQKARCQFHKNIIWSLKSGNITPDEAEKQIKEYFENEYLYYVDGAK